MLLTKRSLPAIYATALIAQALVTAIVYFFCEEWESSIRIGTLIISFGITLLIIGGASLRSK